MSPVLRQEIAKLSHDERVDLIDALLVETARADGLADEQVEELNRRLVSLDEDRKTAVPWQAVRADFGERSQH